MSRMVNFAIAVFVGPPTLLERKRQIRFGYTRFYQHAKLIEV